MKKRVLSANGTAGSIPALILCFSTILASSCQLIVWPIEHLWEKAYSGDTSIDAHGLLENGSGGYIISGQTTSFGSAATKLASDIWIANADANGKLLWQKRLENGKRGSTVFSCENTRDGGYLIAGSEGLGSDSILAESQGLILKIDQSGTLSTQKILAVANPDMPWILEGIPRASFIRSVSETRDGFICLVQTGQDWAIVKLDSAFSVVWKKLFDSGYSDYLYSQAKCSDESIIVCGFFNGYLALMKIDSAGLILWQKRYGALSQKASIIAEGDGGFLVYGSGTVLRIDAEGQVLASAIIDLPKQGFLLPPQALPSTEGSFLVSFGDGVLFKLDSAFDIRWQRRYPLIYGIAYAQKGNILILCRLPTETKIRMAELNDSGELPGSNLQLNSVYYRSTRTNIQEVAFESPAIDPRVEISDAVLSLKDSSAKVEAVYF